MTAEHVNGLQPLLIDVRYPAQQRLVAAPVQGVDHESGKEEIVDGIALPRDFLVDASTVFCMDLGEDGQAIFLRYAPQTLQILPGAGPVEEIWLTGLLVQVCKGIEADNPGAVFTEFTQCLVVEVPDPFRTGVQDPSGPGTHACDRRWPR